MAPSSDPKEESERIRNSSNPYDVLGVKADATSQEIKSAYRKLALRHHPDKQSNVSSANAKAESSQLFVKIGAAYEILSDDDARRKFDEEERLGKHRNTGFGGASPGFPQGGYDPFGSFGFSGFGFGRRRNQGFTDPFDLFSSAFEGDPFFHRHSEVHRQHHQSHSRQHQQSRDPFSDPFFPGFGSMGSFGRSGAHDPFAQMEQMMRQMHGGAAGFSSFSSHSSNFGTGQARESVSTTTRIVNGRRVTQIERTVVRPDGTVERHVETQGDESLLPQKNLPSSSAKHSALGYHSREEAIDLTQDEDEHATTKKKRGLFGRK